MASLIPGFEYDIFISYRQKDNKGDKWVNQFVEALKIELEATFKEDVSVYFDENPHDGLQETHNVDKSLEGKLKCLIFIPILSRTYCDPNCYAWQYEFLTFLRIARNDHFGKDIKLRNGNVASRILPVRIHDLEQVDINLFEKETGSVLRPMDLVFKTASGVNRPLKGIEDHPQDNINRIFYSDQINKVANAIKDIITAIGRPIPQKEEISKEVFKPISSPRKGKRTKIIIGLTIGLVLVLLGYLLFPKLHKSQQQIEKSIAVLPFRNDSPDQENTYFINSVMEGTIYDLREIKDFKVLPRTSVEKYRVNTNLTVHEIAKELGVNYIVSGSGVKYGKRFILRVELIAAQNEKHLWENSWDLEILGTGNIIPLESRMSKEIVNELKGILTSE